ncbi:DUF6285 domain-containing protein [Glaciimonas sp. PCH181]|uniref:DUF6285 domain-containing protein n=1 Tax=Glaciimonas sp. PCH181 TaxID=2133943 RepID=UPI000D3C9B95|nr:DUF6285 domain-containing protein [Glaciimonas sp. PCH181]PUA20223.1 hypothetical protein C7W93_10725 [Glaciimonas sp. PCH181]
MHKQVDGKELLKTAREALLQHLLPALPETLRYEARMIANAMLIASRELTLAAQTEQLELATLRQLLGDTSAVDNTGLVSEEIIKLRRSLSIAIRDGEFDAAGAQQKALFAALTEITRRQLAISNPRAIPSV